jgi:hypothetical protein
MLSAIATCAVDDEALEVGVESVAAEEREGERSEVLGLGVHDLSAAAAREMYVRGDGLGVVHRTAVGEVDVLDDAEFFEESQGPIDRGDVQGRGLVGDGSLDIVRRRVFELLDGFQH